MHLESADVECEANIANIDAVLVANSLESDELSRKLKIANDELKYQLDEVKLIKTMQF